MPNLESLFPWVSKRGIWDVPGILPGCPGPLQVFKKKSSCAFFVPYISIHSSKKPRAWCKQGCASSWCFARGCWDSLDMYDLLCLNEGVARRPAPRHIPPPCSPHGADAGGEITLSNTSKLRCRKGPWTWLCQASFKRLLDGFSALAETSGFEQMFLELPSARDLFSLSFCNCLGCGSDTAPEWFRIWCRQSGGS